MSQSLLERLVVTRGKSAVVEQLSLEEREALLFQWRAWARPEQLAPPGDWRVWLVLAGRGFGKTRTGAEFVREEVEAGRARRIALVARTAGDVREVMVEGESGLLSVHPPHLRPRYEPSKRRITWPNGAIATTFTADEPDLLRGPQHDLYWGDEVATWQYRDAWDQLMFGLRLGRNPRGIVTTTPRPTELVRELLAAPTTIATRGSTYDNRANLAPAFLDQIVSRYEGTRLGLQELHAVVLEDVPGALWSRASIEQHRVQKAPPLRRIVLGVDPAITNTEDSDLTGIVGAGLGEDGHGYVLSDESLRESPNGWARKVVDLFRQLKANLVVAEVNQGGDMVRTTLRVVDPSLPFRGVHAKRGKYLRAEPVAALYEQGRVHHVGVLADLETEMCSFAPDVIAKKSPNRVDALVYALRDLIPVVDLDTGRRAAPPPPEDPFDRHVREQEERESNPVTEWVPE